MPAFRIRKEWILSVLGYGSDEDGADELSVSSINVRLEEMFREAITGTPNIFLLQDNDLTKLIEAGPEWRAGAKTLSTKKLIFEKKDLRPDDLVSTINNSPLTFARQLFKTNRLAFCQSPVFHYTKAGSVLTVHVYMHVIFAPGELVSKDQDDGQAQLPQADSYGCGWYRHSTDVTSEAPAFPGIPMPATQSNSGHTGQSKDTA